MGECVQLVHSVPRDQLEDVRRNGIKAVSKYADLGLEMRRGVVYCWLKEGDDKLSSGGQRSDSVYVEVTVEEARCLVADMDLISIALMYDQASGGRPRNPEASRLLCDAYRVTAVPLSEYTPGMFCTPEVLVKGDIAPDRIRLPENLG